MICVARRAEEDQHFALEVGNLKDRYLDDDKSVWRETWTKTNLDFGRVYFGRHLTGSLRVRGGGVSGAEERLKTTSPQLTRAKLNLAYSCSLPLPSQPLKSRLVPLSRLPRLRIDPCSSKQCRPRASSSREGMASSCCRLQGKVWPFHAAAADSCSLEVDQVRADDSENGHFMP